MKNKFFGIKLPPPYMGKSLYNSTLRLAVFGMLILSSFFLFNACNKDKEFTDPPIQLRNDALSTILSKINFDQNGNILLGSGSTQVTLQHASIEYQREVSDYIFDNLSFSRIDSMREMYGLPVWELAIIKDIQLEGESYNASNKQIVVPLVKDKKLTSIIFYENINNTVSCTLYDNDDIQAIISNIREENSFFETFFPVIANYQIMNIFIERKSIENFNNWIANALLNIRNSQINPRYVWLDCYEIITMYYNPGTYTETIVVETECIVRYGGGSGNTLPKYSNFGSNLGYGGNAGGNGTFGDSNDKIPKKDLEIKLLCANKVADFMAKTEVHELISNNNLTDPCDPTKSAAELLQKALEGYCVNKKGAVNLNLKDAEHFLGEIMEGGDYIIEDQSFINCKNVHCILQKLIKNPLNSNSYNSICALDNSKNYMFNFTMGNANKTTFDPNNPNIITITIDNKLCNSKDPVNIAETLLHEGTHGIIFGNFANNFDANIFNSQNWNNVINNNYGGNVHEFMTDYLLNIVCGALWEFNGKRGTPNDYWGVVLNGLYQNLDNNGNFLSYNSVIYDWLTNPLYSSTINPTGMSVEAWIADMMQRYTNNIQNHPNGFGVKFDCP